MARSTMATLITFVRDHIGDTLPQGSGQIFTDDQIQTELDANRTDIIPPEVLIPAFSVPNGAIGWLDFYSSYPYWEDGATLYGMGWQVITASVTEPLREPDREGKAAHFQFATTQFSVRAQGHSFDVWNVCANMLERIILLQAPTNVNFSANGQRFDLAGITQTRMQMVQQYRAKQRIGSVRATRQDVISRAEWEKRQRIGITSANVPFIDGR